jgi:hypothetical protein
VLRGLFANGLSATAGAPKLAAKCGVQGNWLNLADCWLRKWLARAW